MVASVKRANLGRSATPPDEFALPPEMEHAPLYAQMLWVQQRRTDHRLNNSEMRFEAVAQEVRDTLTGFLQTTQDSHDEVINLIGKSGDERGMGAVGLAGEVARLSRQIGAEPVEGVHQGSGVLGRLAKHDQAKTALESTIREWRTAAVAVGISVSLLGSVLWFVLHPRLEHLFQLKGG